MHLKSIELKGFKSFADRVKIDFEPDITGIIGPNGSGKSNISDAIRWVLGEQSAKSLRGNKMKDVIFAGSDKRKGLGMAEVSITLDNSDGELDIDYNQVKITRRVSADGASDYLINNNSCRLKDIKELIMDTGLGKESYAIIGQGKVDAVLNGKTTDRRELFEEAAEISKHKQRKKEAVRKLEKNKQKLQRVKDIIGEIKKQVLPLEKEAKKAKEFKEYKQQLEKKEVNLLGNKFEKLDKKFDNQVAEKQKLSYQKTNCEAELNEYQLKADRLEEDLKQIKDMIDDKNTRFYKLKEEIKENENKIELVKERKKNLAKEKDYLQKEIREDKNKIQRLADLIVEKKEKIKKITAEIKDKDVMLNKQKDKLKTVEDKLNKKLAKKNAFQQDRFDKLNSLNDYKHQIEGVNKELELKKSKQAELLTKKDQLKEKLANLKNKSKEKANKLEKINETLKELKNKTEKSSQKEERLEEKINKLSQEISSLSSEFKDKQSRLKFLQDLEKSYKGYYRGVRNLMKYAKKKKKTNRIFGVVAELINTKKNYETAIEVALGSILQNVIVEDEIVAKKSINYLKENNLGRATFLPLSMLKPRSLRKREEEALKLDGVIAVAKDLVDYNDKFAPVIKNILGRILVTKDMDSAIKASKKTNKRLKIVTVAGEIINPGGAITGGSRNNNNNLLGRSREIDNLKEEKKDLKNKLEQKEASKSNLVRKLSDVEVELERISNQAQKLKIQQNTYQLEIKQKKSQINDTKETINGLKTKTSSLSNQKKELKSKKKELELELDNLNQSEDDYNNLLVDLTEKIEVLEDKKESINQNITDIKVKLASFKQEIHSLQNESDDKKEEIENLKQGISKKEAKIKRLDKKREEIINRGSEFKTEKVELLEKTEIIRQEIKEMKAKKNNLSKKAKEIKDKAKKSKERFEKLRSKYNRLEVSLGQLEVKLDNIEEELEEKYQLTIDDAIQNLTEIDDDKVAVEIKRIKQEMKVLKPVNLGAIEEFATLKERYEFLQGQHNDLIEARDSLQEVIEKINKQMSKKFLMTFNKIKVEFEEIFVDLFEGGQAELELEDENDLLDTGIEINAQPPGKKLKKLSLMSGGEKALTATALIFALLKVMPSPFYVLDELDAPLDEANVDRYCNYLRKLSSISQFIVITHRKRTMRAVDALYGVTMQESGVSKLLSLKFDNLKAESS